MKHETVTYFVSRVGIKMNQHGNLDTIVKTGDETKDDCQLRVGGLKLITGSKREWIEFTIYKDGKKLYSLGLYTRDTENVFQVIIDINGGRVSGKQDELTKFINETLLIEGKEHLLAVVVGQLADW